MAINQFVILGHITKDVELRYTPNNTPTVTYTVASNSYHFDRDGNRHEAVDFIPVTTYGKQAENDAKYLKKGSSVAVTGRIRSWFKKEDNKGGFNFEADRVQYLNRPGRSSDALTGNSDTPLPSEQDQFLRDYEAVEREQNENQRRDGLH